MRNERTSSVGFLAILGALVVLAGQVACQAPQAPAETGGEPSTETMESRSAEGAVIAAHRALIRAFEEGDPDSLLELFDPTSRLLIFHPMMENRFDGAEEARSGLARMLTRVNDLSWTEVHPTIEVRGNVAWHTSQVLLKSPAMESPFIGRGTEIWILRDGNWRLTHGHWSEHASLAGGQEQASGS